MTSEDVPPQRPSWLILCAWAAFLSVIPSALWRVAMIMGWLPGTSEFREQQLAPGAIGAYLYVYALSLVQLGFGFLSIGLVRPWGERLFGWRIPRVLPTLAGLLGGLVATWLFNVAMVSAVVFGHRPDGGTISGWPLAVMVWCYLPLLLWGPLVVMSACGYWWARRAPSKDMTAEHAKQDE